MDFQLPLRSRPERHEGDSAGVQPETYAGLEPGPREEDQVVRPPAPGQHEPVEAKESSRMAAAPMTAAARLRNKGFPPELPGGVTAARARRRGL